MEIVYTPVFLKKIKKLPKDLQNEVIEKVELYKIDSKNQTFKVHPLHGKFAGSYVLSVNYYYRIIFEYVSKHTVVFLDFGDHDIYK